MNMYVYVYIEMYVYVYMNMYVYVYMKHECIRKNARI
jgi:hypothetical protein